MRPSPCQHGTATPRARPGDTLSVHEALRRKEGAKESILEGKGKSYRSRTTRGGASRSSWIGARTSWPTCWSPSARRASERRADGA